jgi:hypothetical protein
MKDRFFKSEIKSCFVENGEIPVYDGSSDLYPKRNRNLINDEHSAEAAIKIQRFWRGRASAPLRRCDKMNKNQVELEKIVKKDVPERFWSWFGF